MRLTLTALAMFFSIGSLHAQQPPGSDIWLITLPQPNLAQPAKSQAQWQQITDAPFYHNQPYFSQNGNLLYFTAADETGQTDLFEYDLALGSTRNITQSATSEYSPTPRSGQSALSGIWVDENGKQWLTQWSLAKPNPSKLLTLEPIGYHVWINDSEVLVFVLATEDGGKHTLQRATVLPAPNKAKIIDVDIGASLWSIPHQSAKFSYSKRVGDTHYLMEYDAREDSTRQLALLPASSQYYAWTPAGQAVTVNAEQNGLIRWEYRTADGWEPYLSFADHCPAGASRMAFSPNGERLALVCPRAE